MGYLCTRYFHLCQINCFGSHHHCWYVQFSQYYKPFFSKITRKNVIKPSLTPSQFLMYIWLVRLIANTETETLKIFILKYRNVFQDLCNLAVARLNILLGTIPKPMWPKSHYRFILDCLHTTAGITCILSLKSYKIQWKIYPGLSQFLVLWLHSYMFLRILRFILHYPFRKYLALKLWLS